MPSRPVDEKIAKLTLDTDSFKKKATEAVKYISEINNKLNATNSVKMDSLEKNVESISNRFTLMGNIVQNVFGRIANTVVTLGSNIFRALNVEPLLQGYSEYELKLNSIQTIMVNTGESIDVVSAALQELNEYADKTIYSFSDMTRNIGLFTAAGVDLQTSVTSIKGIANLAAGMGVSNAEAARATWQLSQALGTGYVRLQDWMSVENAGLGGQYFQKALVDHANKVGTLSMSYEELTKKYGSFRASLTEGQWLTSEVLASTLEQFANDQTLVDAATKVKSFSQLMDTTREALGSGWAQTWEILFGNIEEAKELWTPISNAITSFVERSSDARNRFLQEWKDLGGLDSLLQGLANSFQVLKNIVTPIRDALGKLIPDVTPKKFAELTKSFEEFTGALAKSDFSVIGDIFDGITKAIDKVKGAFKELIGAFNLENLLTLGGVAGGVFLIDKIGNFINSLKALIKNISNVFTSNPIQKISDSFDALSDSVHGLVYGVNPFTLAAVAFSLVSIANAMKLLADLDLDAAVQDLVLLGIALTEINVIMGYLKPGQLKSGGTMLLMAMTLKVVAGVISDLSTLDFGSALKAIAMIGLILGEFTIAMTYLEGIEAVAPAGTLIALAITIKMLADVVEDLSKVKASSALKAVGVIGLLLAELKFAMTNIKPGSFDSGKIIALSVSLGILAGVIDQLSQIKASSALKAVGVLGIVLAELAVASKYLSTVKMESGPLLALSTSIGIISLALNQLSQIKASSALKAVGVLGVVLAELSIAMKYMKGDFTGGGTMLMMASSLMILSGALKVISSIPFESLLTSVIALETLLFTLQNAMTVMQGSVVGGATFLLVAAGLTVLSGALKLLSTIPIDGVASALLLIGGSLGILVATSYALNGAMPGLLGLAAILLSFSAAAAGIGFAATGIAALVEAITGFIELVNNAKINIDFGGLISSFITGIVENTPLAIEALVNFINQLLLTLAEAIPSLVNAGLQMIIAFIQGMADAINNNTEPLVQAFYNLLGALLNLLYQVVSEGISRLVTWVQSGGVQQAIQSGIEWVLGLISGIGQWIGNLAQSGIQAVQNFVQGLLAIPGEIINAGIQAVQNFIQGMESVDTTGAGESSAQEAKRGMESVDTTGAGENFVQGFINGIGNMVGSALTAAKNLASSAWNALTGFLGIESPSRLTTEAGQFFTQGFTNGINALAGSAKQASKNVAVNAMAGLNSLIGTMPNSDFDFQPTITPIWDLSGYQAIDDLMYKYDLPSMHAEIQNGSNSKLLKVLESIDKKLDSLANKMEDVKLHVSVPPTELDGEAITDAVDEIHTIRDLLDKTGKGE
nr:MAG TPA: tail tape measure [Caudoviricetes sp.]